METELICYSAVLTERGAHVMAENEVTSSLVARLWQIKGTLIRR